MKAIIVCNGETPSRDLLLKELKDDVFVVGADGGGNVLLDSGFTPDVVIGDMDSFDTSKTYDFEVIIDTDQETNDLEKALKLVLEKGCKDCLVLGGLGLRLDHSLKNLSVLQAFDPKFHTLVLQDDHQTVFVLPRSFTATYKVGTTLSLFPISGKVECVKTKGLKYPLVCEALENGTRDGNSNEVIEEHIGIEYSSGCLLAFILA